jgi:tetratricopeptide (TPR) repeat protein
MPSAVTIGERIVLHLAQYSKFKDGFDAPLEVSQDGIAEALRISRAHAAIELKKLKEVGDVTEKLAHIRRGPTKRKVYFLTETGERRAKNLKEFVEEQGIEIAPLLDLKKCKGPELWEATSEDFRPVLAMAAVFRRPFKRSFLPDTTISLLPENRSGIVDMPQELKEAIPKMVAPEQLRQYHSQAADYWLREGNNRERLYHLIQAGRTKEAEMLVHSHGKALISTADPDLLELLLAVPTSSEKYGPKVLVARGMTARIIGNKVVALETVEQMCNLPSMEMRRDGSILKARILLDMDEPEEALRVLDETRTNISVETDFELECCAAEVLSRMKKGPEAVKLLLDLMNDPAVRNDPDKIEVLYHRIGNSYLAQGNALESIKYLSKALGMARPGDKRRIHETMSQAYTVLGLQDKAKEHAIKADIKRSG